MQRSDGCSQRLQRLASVQVRLPSLGLQINSSANSLRRYDSESQVKKSL